MSHPITPPPICPRCRGFIPSNERPGEYAGAGSRLTDNRSIEICSACGTDEAIGRGLIPQEAWPILTRTSVAANIEPSLAEQITEHSTAAQAKLADL